jgi:hypothetical protein
MVVAGKFTRRLDGSGNDDVLFYLLSAFDENA